MGYITLNKFDDTGRVVKYDSYKTEAEASDRVAELVGLGYTDAFYISDPDINPTYLDVNLATKSVVKNTERKAVETTAYNMQLIRNHRDGLLAETDWTGNPDVTMSDAMKTYRQELRDIPASNTVYKDVTWPTKPE